MFKSDCDFSQGIPGDRKAACFTACICFALKVLCLVIPVLVEVEERDPDQGDGGASSEGGGLHRSMWKETASVL